MTSGEEARPGDCPYDLGTGEPHVSCCGDTAAEERDQLAEAVERVKALHAEQANEWWNDGDRETDTFGPTECAHDFKKWPCPTIRAIEEE